MVTRTKRRKRANPRRSKRYSAKNRKRPTLYRSGGRWYAPRRKKAAVKKGARINPSRRRAIKPRKRRTYRRNPAFKINSLVSKQFLTQVAGIGGGIALGYITLPLVYTMLPTEMAAKNRNFLGVINVVLGGLMAGMLKNKTLKTMGFTVAGTGVYDLIAYNTQDSLGLAPIPEVNMLVSGLFSKEDDPAKQISQPTDASYETGYSPVSRVAMGASYTPLGASYESGMDTVGLGHDYGSEVYNGML